MIGAPPAAQTQTKRTPEPPFRGPAPSPKRPPLSKPSSAPPKRKRRRPPPPLSVTSVFTQHRLPTNASELWEWPVTSWYVGEVGQHDLKLATEQPFLDHQALACAQEAKTPPNHYRLRWLEQDARRIAQPHPSQTHSPVDPFGTLPYAGKKDSGACERPMPGVKRHLEDADDHKILPSRSRRKAKRVCTASRSGAATFAQSNQQIAPATDTPVVLDDNAPSREAHSQECPAESAPDRPENDILPPDNDHRVADEGPSSHQQGLGTSPDITPMPKPRHQDECLDCGVDPSLQVLSNQQSVNANENHDSQKLQKNQLLDQTDPTDPSTSTNMEVDTPIDAFKSSEAPNKRLVNLQFQSPHESRLMGSITYSVAVPAVNDGVDKALNDDGHDTEGDDQQMEAEVHPGSFDLQFRKVDQDFAARFDDRDVADELRSEIRRRSNMLLPLDERAKPLRAAMLDALQNEIEKQKGFADLIAEGDRLVAKLKEVQQQKKAAKNAAKQTAKEIGSSNRRASDRKRLTSRTNDSPVAEENGRRSRSRSRRPSRPSRKVIDISDGDDSNPDEQPETIATIPDMTPSPRSRDTGTQLHDKSAQTDTSVVGATAPRLEKASDSAETLATTAKGPSNGTRMTARVEGEANAERGPSTASSPSDDGTEMCIMKSPCGLFPGENEDASQLACIASPVSPLRGVSPGAKNGNYPQLKIALRLGPGPK